MSQNNVRIFVKNKFYLSPPSECVKHHLLVEISTKDSCLSESKFFFCLIFWSLRLTALRLDPDSGVIVGAILKTARKHVVF